MRSSWPITLAWVLGIFSMADRSGFASRPLRSRPHRVLGSESSSVWVFGNGRITEDRPGEKHVKPTLDSNDTILQPVPNSEQDHSLIRLLADLVSYSGQDQYLSLPVNPSAATPPAQPVPNSGLDHFSVSNASAEIRGIPGKPPQNIFISGDDIIGTWYYQNTGLEQFALDHFQISRHAGDGRLVLSFPRRGVSGDVQIGHGPDGGWVIAYCSDAETNPFVQALFYPDQEDHRRGVVSFRYNDKKIQWQPEIATTKDIDIEGEWEYPGEMPYEIISKEEKYYFTQSGPNQDGRELKSIRDGDKIWRVADIVIPEGLTGKIRLRLHNGQIISQMKGSNEKVWRNEEIAFKTEPSEKDLRFFQSRVRIRR